MQRSKKRNEFPSLAVGAPQLALSVVALALGRDAWRDSNGVPLLSRPRPRKRWISHEVARRDLDDSNLTEYILAQRTFLLLQSLIAKVEAVTAAASTETWRMGALLSSLALDVRLMTALQVLQENREPKGGMGGRHAATTQGF